jgi:hypothetical protein
VDSLRMGLGPLLLPVPGPLWTRSVKQQAASAARLFARLPDDQRRVRRFVVRELGLGAPAVEPEQAARALGLPLERVTRSLAELEAGLLFLYRDGRGAVEWAYPFTAAPTPHRLGFDSGEEAFAA